MPEVAHTLRMLELIGRTDIPVVRGAEYPLVRSQRVERRNNGSCNMATCHGSARGRRSSIIRRTSWEICLKESPPRNPPMKTPPHFLLRMVHKFPNQVTIYAGGPMTNLALAISIDPEFAGLAKELIFMGGSFKPVDGRS